MFVEGLESRVEDYLFDHEYREYLSAFDLLSVELLIPLRKFP